ncbi:hypothetical protein DVA67_005150 [Solirubrobacter sp. CPCC 204708]|uniref:Uncharacterized protein n=1 Tax=Solirubrobacter deserti TaxID=2282478 RepID=A0ABT4RH06_9ACTN|nr:hypothetical protein [Solirubrobacter deserti]MBE2315351.1 hypothetical protein [Solirubrobacter deserti]MDA0137804.1 hypothetical protein [Solirubrobacter deserti]
MALVAVTDHAAERYLQRVRGALDPKLEVTSRVSRAVEADRVEPGERGAVLVRDLEDAELVFICIEDVPRGELIVITLWEGGEDPRVPKRFTDELRRAARATPRSWV